MKRLTEKTLFLLFIVVVVAGIVLPACATDVSVSGLPLPSIVSLDPAAGSPAPDGVKENVRVQLSALPLTFVPNRGQYDPTVAFVVTGPASTLFFTYDDIVITAEERNGNGSVSHVVRQTFPGASANPMITGTDQLAGTANFFIGNDSSKWQINVPTFGTVEYHDLYPGIDLRYRGTEVTLKREFIVAPGADPSAIRLRYDGVDSVAVDGTGALVLITGGSTMTESPLICYQEINGKVVVVSAAYRVLGDHEVDFILGPYDPAFPLVIDPRLVYSSFLGGSGDDEGLDIAVDGGGNAYVTGTTTSTGFPTTAGAYNRTYGGNIIAFVTKLNPAGSGLLYSTFLGGSGGENGEGIAVDGTGNAYITGTTCSPDFPTTALAYDLTYGSTGDAFVTKLNAAGSGLLYSTYLGGSSEDYSYQITVDGGGNAYVTGTTYSANFPTTAGAYNRTYGGSNDAYVTKLNTTGSGLLYSTYLGGSGFDLGHGIAVDGSGNAYVTGETQSPDFPTTAGGYDLAYDSITEAFVTKLNPAGSDLLYSTYLGGPGEEWGNAIAVDGTGNAYVTGHTSSPDFPTTPGAYNRTYGGSYDAYVTKLNPAGSGLLYSTYLGGSGDDNGRGLSVDGSGNACVAGITGSPDFPTTAGAYNRTYGGSHDAFVTRLNPAGSHLLYSTFLGGSSADYGEAIAVDGTENAYVTGYTSSSDFPTTAVAYDINYNTNTDAFVAKFSLAGSGIGVFRNSTHKFYLDKTGDGVWNTGDTTYSFGNTGDLPVTGDWDNDGITEIGVFRNATHKFYLDKTGNGAWGSGDLSFSFGNTGDLPVAGDWNSDGTTEIGVYRPSAHTFYLDKSGNGNWGSGDLSYSFGNTVDLPLAGDWNGDGRTEIGVFRNASHKFYLDKTGNGVWNAGDTLYTFGNSGDIPITGDWDSDGTTEIGVYRPSGHTFYLDKSGNGNWGSGDTTYTFGNSGDSPVAGVWG